MLQVKIAVRKKVSNELNFLLDIVFFLILFIDVFEPFGIGKFKK